MGILKWIPRRDTIASVCGLLGGVSKFELTAVLLNDYTLTSFLVNFFLGEFRQGHLGGVVLLVSLFRIDVRVWGRDMV